MVVKNIVHLIKNVLSAGHISFFSGEYDAVFKKNFLRRLISTFISGFYHYSL